MFFLIRHSQNCLCAETVLDNAIRGMVTVRLVIPRHTASLLVLHMVPPPIHSPEKVARATHTEISGNFHVCIQPEPAKQFYAINGIRDNLRSRSTENRHWAW
jgi:hypothetical protein